MALLRVLIDVKLWVAAGIVLGLALGFDSPDAATILMFVLIAQMTVSLDGISFAKEDFKAYGKRSVGCIVACFGINTIVTLLTGLLFIDDTGLWYGWVMLSSVPCAVSVVVCTLTMRGDAKMSVLGLIATYVAAIALTPLITHLLIGDAVSPSEIIKYILMFILIPFILVIPVKRLHAGHIPKSIFINLMMFLLVFVGLGSRRDFILGDPQIIVWVLIACLIRVFAIGFVMIYAMRAMNVRRDQGVVYLANGVWKNSGMSVSLSMALFATVYPDAVLPCIASLIAECIWFAVMSAVVEKAWPLDGTEPALEAD